MEKKPRSKNRVEIAQALEMYPGVVRCCWGVPLAPFSVECHTEIWRQGDLTALAWLWRTRWWLRGTVPRVQGVSG